MSGAQRLPNGNTFIVDSLAGTIFQATPDGKTAWKYTIPWHYRFSLWQYGRAPARLTHRSPLDLPLIKNEMYRASWYPPGYAGLQALDLTPGAYLEDTPDLLEWARAALLAGDFGERLADSDFDIYLDDAGAETSSSTTSSPARRPTRKRSSSCTSSLPTRATSPPPSKNTALPTKTSSLTARAERQPAGALQYGYCRATP